MIKRYELSLMHYVLAIPVGEPANLRTYPMPEKRLYAILVKWSDRGLWEHGVSPFSGWIPDRGKFAEHMARVRRNVI